MYSSYLWLLPCYDSLACFSCSSISFAGRGFFFFFFLCFSLLQVWFVGFLKLSHLKFVRHGFRGSRARYMSEWSLVWAVAAQGLSLVKLDPVQLQPAFPTVESGESLGRMGRASKQTENGGKPIRSGSWCKEGGAQNWEEFIHGPWTWQERQRTLKGSRDAMPVLLVTEATGKSKY